MITSKQILRAVRLKSAKTLTRWANAGFIPKPHIGTHPKGRGKIAYWPDWVLERCQQIVRLQRQGHSLASAVRAIEYERMLGLIDRVETSSDIGTILSEKKINLAQGGEIDLASLLHLHIAKGAGNVISESDVLRKLLAEMRSVGVAARGIQYLKAGYNPICIFDGQKVDVVPDFCVAHRLADRDLPSSSLVIIPLTPSLQKAFLSLELPTPGAPVVRPAPKVRVTEGNAIVEYDILPLGSSDFELIRESARTIPMTVKKPGTDHG